MMKARTTSSQILIEEMEKEFRRLTMKILDTQTGRVHEYGENGHDSLYVSQDGRYLTYYNLQNGDGSGVGDYRFVCDDGKVPAESQTADAIHAEVYFNIGGWPKRPQNNWGKWVISEIRCPNCLEYFDTDCYSTGELNKCPSCGAKMKGGAE